MKFFIKNNLFVTTSFLVLIAAGSVLAAPAQNPYLDFVYPPINSGVMGQVKPASLTIASSTAPTGLGLYVKNGGVSVGTTDLPGTAKLLINGQIRIAGDIANPPGIGKILRSDANGVASWVSPTGYTTKQVIMAFDGASCPSGWSPYTNADGRVLVGTGNSATTGSTNIYLNEKKGTEKEILDNNEIPAHSHTAEVNQGTENGIDENGDDVLSDDGDRSTEGMFSSSGAKAVQAPHNNMQPYFVTTYCYIDL